MFAGADWWRACAAYPDGDGYQSHSVDVVTVTVTGKQRKDDVESERQSKARQSKKCTRESGLAIKKQNAQ